MNHIALLVLLSIIISNTTFSAPKKGRKPDHDWERLFVEQANSGRTIKDFCESRGINKNTFRHNKSTYKKKFLKIFNERYPGYFSQESKKSKTQNDNSYLNYLKLNAFNNLLTPYTAFVQHPLSLYFHYQPHSISVFPTYRPVSLPPNFSNPYYFENHPGLELTQQQNPFSKPDTIITEAFRHECFNSTNGAQQIHSRPLYGYMTRL